MVCDFESWMRGQGLSEATIRKYYIAIRGVLSEWSKSSGIIKNSILELRTSAEIARLAEQLSELPIFIERNNKGNQMYSAAINKYAEYVVFLSRNPLELDLRELLVSRLPETKKLAMVSTRIGQGKFRQELIDIWGSCCVTGYKDVSFLVASHIKPWSQSTDKERLDPMNGLLLLPNLDKTFDAGYITFSDSGGIIISSKFRDPAVMGVNDKMKISIKGGNKPYLSYHRDRVFME